jgi:hypothetical protein
MTEACGFQLWRRGRDREGRRLGAGDGLIGVERPGLRNRDHRTRSRNGPSEAAALPHTPATNPVDTQHAEHGRHQRGRPGHRDVVAADHVRRVRVSARAVLGAPSRPRRRLALGQCPAAAATAGLHPVLGHLRARRGRRGSKTCRALTASTGAADRSAPQPWQQAGAHSMVRSGSGTCSSVDPRARAACPACGLPCPRDCCGPFLRLVPAARSS